jgi:hypothetical protein
MIVWCLLIGGSFFALLGVAYFKYASTLPLSVSNVGIFVGGAFIGVLGPANIYGLIYGYAGKPLNNSLLALLVVAGIPLAALCGGALASIAASKMRRADKSE